MNKPQLMPSRDAVTGFQVNTVLQIVQTMGQFLTQPDIDASNPHKPGGSMDGGARASAEVTFTKACEKLDSILEDKTRWDLEVQRLLELHMAKLMRDQMLFLQAQTAASLALNTPTYLHKPTIINAGNGDFVALLGDPANPACLGVGKSPESACLDFDRSFRGEITQAQLDWLAAHPDEPVKSPQRKRNEKNTAHARKSRAR